jgi:hypothetical protein
MPRFHGVGIGSDTDSRNVNGFLYGVEIIMFSILLASLKIITKWSPLNVVCLAN